MVPVELLSPAGSWDALKRAIDEGCDAIYFGLKSFNARIRAGNFDDSELNKIVGYCHKRGVRVYLAANTLIKNNELKNYFKVLELAYTAGVDAVIIQELSFTKIIKENFPGMQVHISTQAGIFNSYYGELLKCADRVVLPREFTINQVREFINKTNIPVEVFVQGALCFSISGQCLMSSFLGGRSGNRGLCAQPCRKKYNKQFIISTKDLCTIDKLDAIIKSEVASIKIEGRLRNQEYVGAATALYRKALDTGKIDKDAFMDLKLAFSRNYTKGAIFKDYNVVAPGAAGKRGLKFGILGPGGLVELAENIRIGDGIGIYTKKGVHGDIIRKIKYKGRDVDSGLKGQVVKLFVNAKEGDELILTSGVKRRKAAKITNKKEITLNRNPRKITLPDIKPRNFNEIKILVKTYSSEGAYRALEAGAADVYLDIFNKDHPGGEVNPCIPRCLFDWNAKKAVDLIRKLNPSSVLCGDLGVASQLRGIEVYLDLSCNAFNDFGVAYYNELGLIPVISPELSFKELNGFKDKRFAVYAHGRIPLMTTKYVLEGNNLKDEMNYVFPVRRESDSKQILNSIPLGLYGKITQLQKMGVNQFLLDLDGNEKEIVSIYKRILGGEKIEKPKGYTVGNYKRGVI